MDLSKLAPGLKGSATLVVEGEHTAPRVGSGRIAVLATPVLINLLEAAALDCCERLLPAGFQSLGIHLDVRHFAATPAGMRVTATAELLAVDKRTLSFRVEARDEKEPIGDGTHQRVVVNVERFDQRIQTKLRAGGEASPGASAAGAGAVAPSQPTPGDEAASGKPTKGRPAPSGGKTLRRGK